ncbi:ABC transporter substrate-binding protein [Pseudomonas sp. MWU16-30317]|uniref:ABC transporter substrate-binding protein n=1 Tax=Pseudomonas sp. MWU16-30317 TaxID=2878095 RepID=UPI001CFAFC8E|nr:ABC transporter substrate-binding protein [Pseudomonas sp. MWU16-30317]
MAWLTSTRCRLLLAALLLAHVGAGSAHEGVMADAAAPAVAADSSQIAALASRPQPAAAEDGVARQIRDDSGREVTVPAQVHRIADGWYAHHVLLMTLGAGQRIVATVNHPQGQPWMFKVLPSLGQATAINGTAFNVETLLSDRVDLVFTSTGDRQAMAYEQAGVPVMRMGYTDLPGLQRSMLATAQALGGAQPLERAKAYNRYLDEQLATVEARVADVPQAQRPRVLHIASLDPLKVDGSDTLIDQWIQLAGGRNAAVGLKGNLQPVSAEQLLVWQPDLIVLAANAGDISPSSLLQQLPAVQQGHVVRNPAGVFPWDRYGTEVALQLEWAAQQLHPERFKEVDMVAKTMDFYRRFFDYPLTTAEAQRILKGLAP